MSSACQPWAQQQQKQTLDTSCPTIQMTVFFHMGKSPAHIMSLPSCAIHTTCLCPTRTFKPSPAPLSHSPASLPFCVAGFHELLDCFIATAKSDQQERSMLMNVVSLVMALKKSGGMPAGTQLAKDGVDKSSADGSLPHYCATREYGISACLRRYRSGGRTAMKELRRGTGSERGRRRRHTCGLQRIATPCFAGFWSPWRRATPSSRRGLRPSKASAGSSSE